MLDKVSRSVIQLRPNTGFFPLTNGLQKLSLRFNSTTTNTDDEKDRQKVAFANKLKVEEYIRHGHLQKARELDRFKSVVSEELTDSMMQHSTKEPAYITQSRHNLVEKLPEFNYLPVPTVNYKRKPNLTPNEYKLRKMTNLWLNPDSQPPEIKPIAPTMSTKDLLMYDRLISALNNVNGSERLRNDTQAIFNELDKFNTLNSKGVILKVESPRYAMDYTGYYMIQIRLVLHKASKFRYYDFRSSVMTLFITRSSQTSLLQKHRFAHVWKKVYNTKNLNDAHVSAINDVNKPERILDAYRPMTKPFISIGDPDLILHWLEKYHIYRKGSFKFLKYIVIDEADELIKDGKKEQIIKVVEQMQKLRQHIPKEKADPTLIKIILLAKEVNNEVKDLAKQITRNGEFEVVEIPGYVVPISKKPQATAHLTDSIFGCYTASFDLIRKNVRIEQETKALRAQKKKEFKAIILLPNAVTVNAYHTMLKEVLGDYHAPILKLNEVKSDPFKSSTYQRFKGSANGILVCPSHILQDLPKIEKVTNVIQIGATPEIADFESLASGKKLGITFYLTRMEEPFTNELAKVLPRFRKDLLVPSTKGAELHLHTERLLNSNPATVEIIAEQFLSLPSYYLKVESKLDVLKHVCELYHDLEHSNTFKPFIPRSLLKRHEIGFVEAREYFITAV